MDDSTIICDEVIDADVDTNSNNMKLSVKEDETDFHEKKANCKTQNFYVILTF